MAQPHPQTGLGHPSGTAVQSPVPQRQAASGPPVVNTPVVASLNRSADQPATTPPPGPTSGQGSDWGLAPEKPGISRENKFILFVLLILVAVFSFVVFRNFQKKSGKAELASTEGENTEKPVKDGKEEKGKGHSESKSKAEKTAKTETEEAETPSEQDAEPPQLNENPFGEEEAEPPVKTTAHRGAKHRHAHTATDENETVEEVTGDSETAEEIHTEPRRTTTPRAVTKAPTEFDAGETTDDALDQGGLTLAEPRTGNRVSNSEEVEGSAESTDPAMAATNSQDEIVEDTTFEESHRVDANLKQTAGTAKRGAHGAHRQNAKPSTIDAPMQDEVAQAGDPMLADEIVGGTAPRHRTSHRTGAPVSGPPPAQTQQSTDYPPSVNTNDEKYGGMVPQDVQRRPAPRGNFDPQANPLVVNSGEYIIRPNDNYWRISRKVYGTPRYFEALRKHNEQTIPNPKSMKVGLRISTPSRELLEQQYRDILPVMASPKPPGAVYDSPTAPKTPGYFVEPGNQPAYRIGPTDTLSSISQKTLGRSSRWDEIYELNRDRIAGHDELTVGTILRLPPDASQPRLVGTPAVNH